MHAPNPCIAKAWLIGMALMVAGGNVLAQTASGGGIQIQTPKLPPRQASPQASVAAQGAQAGYGPQTSAQPAYGAPAPQSGYAAQAAYAPQGQQGAYAASSSYGQPAAFAGSTGPAPTRAAAGGGCRVEVAPDRQALSLLGITDALPRLFLPLGEFRAQQVLHSPDGHWAVAFLKLRGQTQFAMLTLDLATCREQHTVDLAQAGEDAKFEGDTVTVRFGGKEQQWPLADKRVR